LRPLAYSALFGSGLALPPEKALEEVYDAFPYFDDWFRKLTNLGQGADDFEHDAEIAHVAQGEITIGRVPHILAEVFDRHARWPTHVQPLGRRPQ
jgi:hypothetical protein